MPDEPNRSVEEQLKAWAQQRREEAGAPIELHPATRKLLQDEVARTFPKKTAERPAQSGGWWETLWPRFALAGSVCVLAVILAGLSLPAFSRAKSKAQRITAFNNLKQIGLAARIYAGDHEGKLPANFGQMTNELGTDKVLKDPETGKEFVYLGAGRIEGDRDSVLAYSPTAGGRRPVLLGDGYVQEMDDAQFNEALQRTQRGATTVALATPPAGVPALADNKAAEQEVLAKDVSRDTRLKELDQTSKVQPGKDSEQKSPLELASIDKAKEVTSPPVGAAAVGRESKAEMARNETVLRQRYGLLPAQAGGVASRADAAGERQPASLPAQAPAAGKPRPAQQLADAGRVGVGGGGFGERRGTAGKGVADEKAVSLANQSAATASSLRTPVRQSRAATDELDLLGQQRDAGKPRDSNSLAYYADVSAAQSGQRYAQVRRYRVNFNSPPMPNVLRSFQVEQTGQQIRVVDADGSVYEGALGQPASEEVLKHSVAVQTADTGLKKNIEPELRLAENAPAGTAGETAGAQSTFFRVAGTNRSLNQLVVFQGNFVVNTNQTNAVLPGAKLEAEQSAVAQQQNRSFQSQQPLNALIQGQATIGGKNRIEINAVPVPQ